MYLQQDLNITSDKIPAVSEMLESYVATTLSPVQKSNITQNCDNPSKYTPTSSHDALLYIVVVLLFYACSMVILMIKYVRREKEEAEMAHYYNEYVARERFKSPKYQIQQFMKRIPVPVIKKEDASDDSEDFVSCLNEYIEDNSRDKGNETKTEIAGVISENSEQTRVKTIEDISNLRKENPAVTTEMFENGQDTK